MDTIALNRIVEEFGNRLGLSGLALDDHNEVQLTIDDDLTVTILGNCQEGFLQLSAMVADIPKAYQRQAFAVLLEGNLFWQRTQGGTLSLQPATNTAFLARCLDLADLSTDKLYQELERFTNTVASWQRVLQKVMSESDREKDALS